MKVLELKGGLLEMIADVRDEAILKNCKTLSEK